MGLHDWVEIAGTSGAGGAAADAYCGWCLRKNTAQLYIAAAGGHHNSSDNRVVMCDLAQDAPSWTLQSAASAGGAVVNDSAYYSDGKPSARHTYYTTMWSETRQRVMLMYCSYPYGAVDGQQQFPKVDGFDPVAKVWDAAGTYADAPTGWIAAAQEGNGDAWAILQDFQGARKWTEATATWSTPSMTMAANWVRFPWAWDSTRNQFFGLCWGDGQGGSGTAAIKQSGTVQTQISFNASAAYTQWQADAPMYAGMDYDVANDRFLFYAGAGSAAGRVYVITPNAGSTWDMSILTTTGATPDAADSGGVNNKFTYVPSLGCFVLMSAQAGNLRALRVV